MWELCQQHIVHIRDNHFTNVLNYLLEKISGSTSEHWLKVFCSYPLQIYLLSVAGSRWVFEFSDLIASSSLCSHRMKIFRITVSILHPRDFWPLMPVPLNRNNLCFLKEDSPSDDWSLTTKAMRSENPNGMCDILEEGNKSSHFRLHNPRSSLA